MTRLLPLVALVPLALGCLPAVDWHAEPLPAAGRILTGSTSWSGEVRVAGPVTVPRGSTLAIAPGTRVLFSPGPSGEPAALTVLGGLSAQGTAEAPIFLRSAGEGGPESWEGLRLDYVSGFTLRWVEIRDARYGIHAHFSSGTAEHVRLAKNLEGARIGRSSIAFTGCRIETNESKGLSMTDSSNVVTGCTITGNHYGVFLFEGSRGDRFEGNNIAFNGRFDLRLGDFFSGKITLKGNWWGPDRGGSPGIDPAPGDGGPHDSSPSPVPFPDAGHWPPTMGLRPVATVPTGGFTDAAPAIVRTKAVGGSWGGRVVAFDGTTGAAFWEAEVGAPIDTTPVIFSGPEADLVIVPCWDRTVRAFDLLDGELRWTFTWPPSGYDDHRQGSPALFAGAVVVPAWNGSLYALEPTTGRLLWEREVGGALRARPLVTGAALIAGSDHGRLAAVDASGNLLWSRELAAGIRGTPLALGGRVIVPLRDGRVTALDPATGATAWERGIGSGFEYASPVEWNGTALVADTGGTLFFLSPSDGSPVLTIPLGAPVYATPNCDGGLVAVGDTAGVFRILDPLTGLTIRRADLGAPIQATAVSPAWNRLIVGSRAGAFHLFDPFGQP